MLIRNEQIEIRANGRRFDLFNLNRRTPRIVYYMENDDVTESLAAGKTPHAAAIDEKRRMATAYFNAAFKSLAELSEGDPTAGEDIKSELLHVLLSTKNQAAEPQGADPERPHTKEIKALCKLFDAAEEVLTLFGGKVDKTDPEWGPDFMAIIEKPLDAFALQDPEAATAVYESCEYFIDGLKSNEIYLGQDTFADRSILADCDTPAKRAAYIAGAWIRK